MPKDMGGTQRNNGVGVNVNAFALPFEGESAFGHKSQHGSLLLHQQPHLHTPKTPHTPTATGTPGTPQTPEPSGPPNRMLLIPQGTAISQNTSSMVATEKTDLAGGSQHLNINRRLEVAYPHTSGHPAQIESDMSSDPRQQLPFNQSSQQHQKIQQLIQLKQLQSQQQQSPKSLVLVKNGVDGKDKPVAQSQIESPIRRAIPARLPVIPHAPLFMPRSRRLTTYGGIDLEKLARAIRRSSSCKEQYAIQDLSRLTMSLKSGLQAEVRYALDSLLIFSHEGTIHFWEFPDLLNALVRLAGEVLSELFSLDKLKMNLNRHSYSTYTHLFETQLEEQHMLAPMSRLTLCRQKLLSDCCLSISTILRNASFSQDNQRILATHPGVVELLYWTIDMASLFGDSVSKYVDDDCATDSAGQSENAIHTAKTSANTRDNLFSPKYEESSGLDVSLTTDIAEGSSIPIYRPSTDRLTVTMLHVLDHRKNVIVILSNIGGYVQCKTPAMVEAFLDTVSDFICTPTAYAYPALDALARLMLVTDNLEPFAAYQGMSTLVDRLATFLPDRIRFDMASESHALLELVSMIIYTVTLIGDDKLRQHVCSIPGLVRTLLRLCHLPYVQYIHSVDPSRPTSLSYYKIS
ncbi:hypothetical protein BASA83_001249 [Batrachochytrium salamandrivorans]|nr:hypothetical protein BASA83_001249 [Batrachochytrium salamandrivorans]